MFYRTSFWTSYQNSNHWMSQLKTNHVIKPNLTCVMHSSRSVYGIHDANEKVWGLGFTCTTQADESNLIEQYSCKRTWDCMNWRSQNNFPKCSPFCKMIEAIHISEILDSNEPDIKIFYRQSRALLSGNATLLVMLNTRMAIDDVFLRNQLFTNFPSDGWPNSHWKCLVILISLINMVSSTFDRQHRTTKNTVSTTQMIDSHRSTAQHILSRYFKHSFRSGSASKKIRIRHVPPNPWDRPDKVW